jgi:hypothetical protein
MFILLSHNTVHIYANYNITTFRQPENFRLYRLPSKGTCRLICWFLKMLCQPVSRKWFYLLLMFYFLTKLWGRGRGCNYTSPDFVLNCTGTFDNQSEKDCD